MGNGFSTRFCRKCLSASISVEEMNRFAKMAYPDYDVYKSYGFSKGHPIGIHEAADRIVGDMVQNGYYIDFVEALIRVDSKGYMGRRYAFRGLDDVIGDMVQSGYHFDKTSGLFFEDQSRQITRNWGRLLEGDERQMAILRLDIVGSSVLVKQNPKSLVDKTYASLRKVVNKAVVSRLGRLWTWEGDGALAVFMLGDYSRLAIFAGMEILNELFMFNKMENQLKIDLKLRLAAHSGSLVYSDNETKCLKAEIVRTAVTLESKAATPNSFVISESMAMAQDQVLHEIFSNVKVAADSSKYRMYQVSQGKD